MKINDMIYDMIWSVRSD